MIVFNDSLLFVHNPKTAGTSVASFLQSHLPGNVRSAGIGQLGTFHPSLSMAYGYACGVTGKFALQTVLSVVRNPFDREVSMYVYNRDVLSRSADLRVNLPDAAMQRRVLKAAQLSFSDYLRWLWDED